MNIKATIHPISDLLLNVSSASEILIFGVTQRGSILKLKLIQQEGSFVLTDMKGNSQGIYGLTGWMSEYDMEIFKNKIKPKAYLHPYANAYNKSL